MEQEKFTYTIGDRKYTQRPLVLGQINQLVALTRGVIFPKDANVAVLVGLLGNRLPKALAIVLIEDKPTVPSDCKDFKYLRDRDIQAIADEIEFNVSPEISIQVIEDFFDCNPIASLSEKFAGLGEKILKFKKTEKGSSTPSASSSPEATSPKETPSSGASPSPSASRT